MCVSLHLKIITNSKRRISFFFHRFSSHPLENRCRRRCHSVHSYFPTMHSSFTFPSKEGTNERTHHLHLPKLFRFTFEEKKKNRIEVAPFYLCYYLHSTNANSRLRVVRAQDITDRPARLIPPHAFDCPAGGESLGLIEMLVIKCGFVQQMLFLHILIYVFVCSFSLSLSVSLQFSSLCGLRCCLPVVVVVLRPRTISSRSGPG